MYRDLLPQDPPAISRSSSSTECTAQCGQLRAIPSESERRLKEPLTEFHQSESDQLADRLNGRPSNKGRRNAGHKDRNPCKPLSSNLFLAQEDPDNHWIERHRTTDDSSNTRNIRSIEDASEEHPNPTHSARALKTREQSIPKPSSTIHDTELTLTKMDEILFSRPQSKPPLPRKPKETRSPCLANQDLLTSSIPSTPQEFPPDTPPQNGAPPTESANSSPTLNITCTSSTTWTYNPSTNLPPPKPPPPKPPKPKLRPRLKLKQTISAPTTMHPPPPPSPALIPLRPLDASNKKKKAASNEERGSVWGAEAWDLFGCGRDGVECSYEEFKRKEGLV